MHLPLCFLHKPSAFPAGKIWTKGFGPNLCDEAKRSDAGADVLHRLPLQSTNNKTLKFTKKINKQR